METRHLAALQRGWLTRLEAASPEGERSGRLVVGPYHAAVATVLTRHDNSDWLLRSWLLRHFQRIKNDPVKYPIDFQRGNLVYYQHFREAR